MPRGTGAATIRFLGGAGTVSGSCFLLEGAGTRILVDCGLLQGGRPLRRHNRVPLPVDLATVDAVFLLDAHLEHSGLLPRRMRQGLDAPIYCTAGTRDLCGLILPDHARIQEEHHEAGGPEPLYRAQDARASIMRMKSISYGDLLRVGDVEAVMYPSGHAIGAASLHVTTPDTDVLFSGDLGPADDPVVKPPAPRPSATHIVVEATYGDKQREPVDAQARMAAVLERAQATRGIVLVAGSPVGRAQAVLHHLSTLQTEIPVYVDSPLATDATRVYCNHLGDHRLPEDACMAMCGLPTYVRSRDGSRALQEMEGPAVIIAGTGMATEGRILDHIAVRAPDPATTLLLAGHQAPGTRGDALLQGAAAVKIHGSMVPVRAQVQEIPLSAHADQQEVLRWLDGPRPRSVLVVHGEAGPADALRVHAGDLLGCPVHVPQLDQCWSLDGARPADQGAESDAP